MKTLVIGLDCVPPKLAFDRFAEAMPNLQALRGAGQSAPLRSSSPPITVPAWTVMTTERDPGELGLYGFRNRPRDHAYRLELATGRDVRAKRVWERLAERGLQVAHLFVPLTHPIRPIRGVGVSGFLTPPGAAATSPSRLEAELRDGLGEALIHDVDDFRAGESELPRIFAALDRMRDQHFRALRWVMSRYDPDFTMMVELGPDRLHHAAWRHVDPEHPGYVAGSRWEDAARSYYAGLDAAIGEVVHEARLTGDVAVVLASDHGARAMEGAVAVNEVLARAGLLTLRERPCAPTPLRDVVDWHRTRAWAEGGYYARVMLNVAGREPAGVVAPHELDATRDAVVAALRELRDLTGRPLAVRVERPEEVYRVARGTPPDLMVYFGDLAYRALGTVGHPSEVVADDDRGHDGANHDWNGIVVVDAPGRRASARLEAAELGDISATALALAGEVPLGHGVSLLE